MKFLLLAFTFSCPILYAGDGATTSSSEALRIKSSAILTQMIHIITDMKLPIRVYEIHIHTNSSRDTFGEVCPRGLLENVPLDVLSAIAQKKYFFARPLFVDSSGKPNTEGFFPKRSLVHTISIVVNSQEDYIKSYVYEHAFNILPQPEYAAGMTLPRYRPNKLIETQLSLIRSQDWTTLQELIEKHSDPKA